MSGKPEKHILVTLEKNLAKWLSLAREKKRCLKFSK
jgi:hypothetical protein